ncbi:hypothetical protein H072_1496 [Dactylellina haptotyla CBS 200.50]|uniref:Ubiquitin-like protease family profile domain-containing protein n=1 Tax=Dactylellina haptotyla (strain CBS 200.50) TaxID=1284197 RepID=S8ANI5_DACHA|nr:hypothetical protein H072_1496 [Dactylellina haptotyla CBS 200.50]
MTMTSTTSAASSSGRSSPASLLLRSKSAPAKIDSRADEEDDVPSKRDNFLSRTILAPILFLSFILSLAIVDRKRRLEEDRKLGLLTTRRRLLYLWFYWRIPRSPAGATHHNQHHLHHHHANTDSLSGNDSGTSSRRGSGSSESGGREDEKRAESIMTLAEKQKEARSLSAVKLATIHRYPVDPLAFGHFEPDAYPSSTTYDEPNTADNTYISDSISYFYDLIPYISPSSLTEAAMHVRTRSRNRLSATLDSLRDRVGRGDRLAADQPYLSYHDICLWQEDINCLESDWLTHSGGWLTDNNIAFWEEYMEREILTRSDTHSVLLLRPSMVFLLKVEPNILNILSALPSTQGISHIFLPINDNTNPNMPEGGSHWSLLVVSLKDRVAFHYDSLGGANNRHAKDVCRKVGVWVYQDADSLRFYDLGEDTPQQSNAYDCGVHVCMNMRHLLVKRLMNTPEGKEVNMSLKGKHWGGREGREEMLKVIRSLRRTAERSLSPGDRERLRDRDGKTPPPRIE